MWRIYIRIFCGILYVPRNIVMDMNNVMVRFAFSVGDTTTHAVYQSTLSKTHRIGDAKHNI